MLSRYGGEGEGGGGIGIPPHFDLVINCAYRGHEGLLAATTPKEAGHLRERKAPAASLDQTRAKWASLGQMQGLWGRWARLWGQTKAKWVRLWGQIKARACSNLGQTKGRGLVLVQTRGRLGNSPSAPRAKWASLPEIRAHLAHNLGRIKGQMHLGRPHRPVCRLGQAPRACLQCSL